MSRKTLWLIRAGIWFTAFMVWVARPVNIGFRDGWGRFVHEYKFLVFKTFVEGNDVYSRSFWILDGLANWALFAAAVAVAFVPSSRSSTSSFEHGVGSNTPPGITGVQPDSHHLKPVWFWVTNVALWFAFLNMWVAVSFLYTRIFEESVFDHIKQNLYGRIKFAFGYSEAGIGTQVLIGLSAVSTWIITAVAIYLLVAVFKPKPLVAPVNNVQYSVPPGILD
jgi:hypothetical protein